MIKTLYCQPAYYCQTRLPVLALGMANYYVPEINLGTQEMKRDLTKTVSLTILALILQFSFAAYLNRGGWQLVNQMLQKLVSGF